MTRLRYSRMLMAVVALAFLAGPVIAEVPGVINYQGRLTDSVGDPVADGQYDITFRIWNTPVGSVSLPMWIGDQQAVQVTNGLFSCQVGPIPSSVFTASAERYLGITIGSGDEMEPRTQLISVPYAYHAVVADSTRSTG